MTTPDANASPAPKPQMTMLVSRQLDTLATGNGTYLLTLLRVARRAGLDIRLAFAPRRSFGNRPWMKLHPAFAELVTGVTWTQALRRGDTFWSLSPVVWFRFAARLLLEAGRRAGLKLKVTSLLGDPLSAGEARELAEAADRTPGSLAMAEYSTLGPVLGLLKQHKRKAVFLHDLFSLRAQAFRERGEEPDHNEMTLQEEASLLSDADLLVFASNNEMEKIFRFVRTKQCVWLRPEVEDADAMPESGTAPPRAVFIGTLHAGNTDAMHHLVNDIWPLVRGRSPHAELWIAGSTCKALTPGEAGAPGIKALGRVASLAELGGPNSIGVAPTRIASGVSIKVAEYLTLGMPTVAYPVALEGFGKSLNDLVDVANDPTAFATQIVELLEDSGGRKVRSQRALQQAPKRLDNKEVINQLAWFAAA